VDDNRDSVDAMASWLRTVAEDVRVAYDGKEAIAAAESFHPRVVLLDIGLPDMSGYDVARKLREIDGTKDAYLVAFTGFGRPEDIEEAQEAGIDEHITKPADPEQLMALISRFAVTAPA
jgi:CheY-like chemotaxis protein